MNLQQRKELLVRLGIFLNSNDEEWQAAKRKATAENNWFIPEFIDLSVKNIINNFLQPEQLQQLIDRYKLPDENPDPKKVGIVMAGNIPLVGFHDFLCVFLSGHYALIKPSSKDEALIRHIAKKMVEWNAEAGKYILVSPMIPKCDAYIATGSNNSARYFDFYFKKYSSIIRRNRTSVAILSGRETTEELERLADDVYLYFGLGCRNVTKIYVPEHYNFEKLLEVFRKYDYLINHHKYKNNYDYNLAIHILNNQYYMTNGSILLVESNEFFSPISQLHYAYYKDVNEVLNSLENNPDIQCVVSKGNTGFGYAQNPQICDFADQTDTMKFLISLT